MLYPANDYLSWVIREEMTWRYIRQGENDLLLSEVDLHRPGRLSWQACKALRKLGHLFLALGSALDRVEPQAA